MKRKFKKRESWMADFSRMAKAAYVVWCNKNGLSMWKFNPHADRKQSVDPRFDLTKSKTYRARKLNYERMTQKAAMLRPSPPE